jgi:hypothetical protein
LEINNVTNTPNTFKGNLKYGVSIENSGSNNIGNYIAFTRTAGTAPENSFLENVEVGVYVNNSPGTKILANKFTPNGNKNFDGVVLIGSDNCLISWNKFLNNYRGTQIYNRNLGQAVTEVIRNEYQNNTYGLVISPVEFPAPTCTTNNSVDPQNVQFHCNKFFGTPAYMGFPAIPSNNVGVLGSGLIVDQGTAALDVDNDFALDPFASPSQVRNLEYDIAWDYDGPPNYPAYYYQANHLGPVITLNYLATSPVLIPITSTPIVINTRPYSSGAFHYDLVDIWSPIPPQKYCPTPWSLWKTGSNGIDSKAVGKVTIYPNPTNDFMNINIPEDIHLKEIMIYDMMGREVFSLDNSLKSSTFKIDLSSLNVGMYQLHLFTDNEELNYKVIRK